MKGSPMSTLTDKRILMFVGDDYEDLELWYPKLRLIEEGARVVVAGAAEGKVYRGKNGYPCVADACVDQMEEADFDALVLPGGWMPDKLRRVPKVLELTAQFHAARKVVAHICHGGWIAISAGIVAGYRCTSTPGIRDDLTNAGAEWVDEPVVIDRNMVSSRRPDDLPAFCRGIIELLSGMD